MRIGSPRTRRGHAEALACLLGVDLVNGGSDRVDEALALAESGEIDLAGLLAAWEGGEVVAASLWCVTADGSAFVWPPEIRPDVPPSVTVELLRKVARRADAAGCPYAQAAVEPERIDHRMALEGAGFHLLTDLLVLQRPLDSPLPPKAPEEEILLFSDKLASRFAAVVETSYVGSRDCPGFAGFRTAAEAFRSYRHAGEFTPSRWRLARRDAADAGVILVNRRADEPADEIVYLGVVPAARRSGLARRLVTMSLHEARREGLEAVITSVDASNLPAINLYSRLGFFPTARRSIYVRRAPE